MPINQDFWKFVSDANYVGNNFSWKDTLYSLFRMGYCPKTIESFSDDFDECFSTLQKSIKNSGLVLGIGDDGQDDLVAYIISQGETFYNNRLKDPELIKDMSHSFIPESFAYTFNVPKADYQSFIEENHYAECVKNLDGTVLNMLVSNPELFVKQATIEKTRRNG
jgi:hypothetical protein